MENNEKGSGFFGLDLGKISKYRQEIYGLSIVWIVLLHGAILNRLKVPAALDGLFVILRHGNIGVDIFLLLSGISLYYSFTKDNNLQSYYKKRFTRILVPYGIIGGVYFLYWDVILRGDALLFLRDFFMFNFIFKGNKLVWYVLMILSCYLIYPLIYSAFYNEDGSYRKGSLIRLAVLMAYFIMAAFIIRRFYLKQYNNIEIMLTRFPVFILGSFVAGQVKGGKKVPWYGMLVAWIGAITSYFVFERQVTDDIYQRYYYMIIAVCLVLVFAWLFDRIRLGFLHSFFKFFGAISFELYLTHILIRNLYMKTEWYNGRVYAKYLLLMIPALIVAILVYTVENTLLRAKNGGGDS